MPRVCTEAPLEVEEARELRAGSRRQDAAYLRAGGWIASPDLHKLLAQADTSTLAA